MDLDNSLIGRVRRGEINFERLVDVLETRGYIFDSQPEDRLGFSRSSIDQARQDDFNALFDLLVPGQEHDVRLRSMATDKGGIKGVFTYGLFNESLFSYEEMNSLLLSANREEASRFGTNGTAFTPAAP